MELAFVNISARQICVCRSVPTGAPNSSSAESLMGFTLPRHLWRPGSLVLRAPPSGAMLVGRRELLCLVQAENLVSADMDLGKVSSPGSLPHGPVSGLGPLLFGHRMLLQLSRSRNNACPIRTSCPPTKGIRETEFQVREGLSSSTFLGAMDS